MMENVRNNEVIENLESKQYKLRLVKRSAVLNKRLATWTLVLSILIALVTVGNLLFVWLISQYEIGGVDYNAEYFKNRFALGFTDILPYLEIALFMFIFTFATSIALRKSSRHKYLNLLDLEYYYENENNPNLTEDENLKLKEARLDANKNERLLKSPENNLFTSFVILLHSLSISTAAMTGVFIVSNALYSIVFKVELYSFFVTILAGPLLTTLLMIFPKKKSVSLLLALDCVSIMAVFALTQYVFK